MTLGQSLWLDNITRDLLTSGTLQRYIDELSVTGLTSNPSIFDHAITHSKAYDEEIRRHGRRPARPAKRCSSNWRSRTCSKAADLFAPIHQRTASVDGWVSLEVSPLLALRHGEDRSRRPRRCMRRPIAPNLFIKIPGTLEGLPAIEEAIFCRRAGQRDAAVLARRLCAARPMPICAAWSGASPPG